MRETVLTAVLALVITVASCGYNAMDGRISHLEAMVPQNAGDVAALKANETTTSDAIKRLEKKIDWIIEHVALRK